MGRQRQSDPWGSLAIYIKPSSISKVTVAVADLKEYLVCQVKPSGVGRWLTQSHRASKYFSWSSDPPSLAFLVEDVRKKVGEVQKLETEAA